jgi:pimeloyl-ACP methyl ester carboxylesterase
MAERIDATDLLGQISIPTLLIVGEHDAITPAAEMRALSRAIPASQYIELPAAGHMSPMENAEAFNDAVLRFLEE